MTILPYTPPWRALGSIRALAVVGMVLGLLAIIGALALDVRNRLDELDLADSDNGQWVMMQTEVEVLRLQSTLVRARAGQASPNEVRRWFNVMYSRLRMLEQSPLYAGFIQQPENLSRLKAMQAYADRWVSAIDASDAVLAAALPDMEAQSAEVQRLTRDLSLDSLLMFSVNTDESRASVRRTLTLLATAIAATILLLVLLAGMASRLFRVTQRQARENQIAGERLQLIIATSPDAIVVTNRGGWVVEFNPVAEAMFGLSRNQVLGRQIVPILFSPQTQEDYQARLRDIISAAVRSGPQRFEITGRRADGRAIPLEASLAIRDLNRGALIVTFLRDISQRQADRLALEEALTRARAGEKAKADFLAVMSHEMRTPLNGLIGSMELMNDTTLDDSQRELLRIMGVSGDILLGHVDSVLDLSRTAAGQIRLADTPFALDRLIEDCLANQAGVARAGGNSLQHVPLSGPLGNVRGDPGRLQQILLNLIGNAVKFTRNGTITIETERLPGRTDSTGPQMTEIRVIDTGIGIAPADLGRVFDDFATVDSSYGRAAGGTGLGLGIARRLAQAMGGSIGVESNPGEGSLFWLRLPLPAVAPAPPLADLPVPALRLAPAKQELDILLIEDNSINRFLLRRTLSDLNHRVTEAEDGIEGVAIAARTRFDLIITDISMPRLDGIDAARRIRGGGASMQARIIALTAHALPEDVEAFRQAGLDACLTKPVTREALLAQLYGDADPAALPTRDKLENTALDELAEALGKPVAASLIDRMVAEGDDTLARICAHPAPDAETARIAHQLAGGCTTFGAIALRDALAALERAIDDANRAEAARLIATLPALWADTRQALATRSGLLVA
ncbi:MAG: ATP-binding protein [Pseudotabrizicola sp.]|uniref:hybrid sensor histidine kinase/response regulator n=1 Tax=Pseudotabrizicola sp. TaxID=2939647 RepID=UPI00271856CF|nr:ATP-binding protein [Pseudotabrizicola sp.]MDO9639818.1 ATP-binding protein [Pseudotabrizicola sp.]